MSDSPWSFPRLFPVRFATVALLAIPLVAPLRVASAQQPDTVSYSIAIDCAHGAIRREGTATMYQIVGVSDNGEEYSFTPDSTDMRRLTGNDCRYGVAPFTTSEALSDSVRIRRFRIGLIGGQYREDALFLDSLQLTMRGPLIADSLAWDVDGGSGWCISHDPDDARGEWRHWVYDGQCYPCLEFSLLPRVEGDSIIDGEWKETAAPGYGECPAEEEEPPP
jgi:hypothetical protein